VQTGPTAGPPIAGQMAFDMNIVKCECGLQQSADVVRKQGGRCILCKKEIRLGGEKAAEPEKPSAPAEPDPWKLRPESVQPKANPNAVPAVLDGLVVVGTTEGPGPDPGLGNRISKPDDRFDTLHAELSKHGFTFSLSDIAKWHPAERVAARAFLDGELERIPDFLESLAKLGYRKRPEVRAQRTTAPPPVQAPEAPPETVRYVWGEEKFAPIAGTYSTVTVGPFSATTTLRPGETADQALERLRHDVEKHAASERESKIRSFIAKLKGLINEARS
jgi:hypothetical protein